MRHFDLVTAKDTNHAVMLLAQHSATSKVRIVAGGTDLMADLKFAPASHAPDVVVEARARGLLANAIGDEVVRLALMAARRKRTPSRPRGRR